MREIIVKKHKHTVGRIKDLFLSLEIKFRFHSVNSKDNLADAEKKWLRFYELASSYVAPVELVDSDAIEDGSSDFEGPDSPITDARCYRALLSALIFCLKVDVINDENAYYGILDGVDKLNSAWHKLGQAELYAEIEIESADNSVRAAKGGILKNNKFVENRIKLAEVLRGRILDAKDGKVRMTKGGFIEGIKEEVFEIAADHKMGYCHSNFERILSDVLKEKELDDLFKIHLAKR